MFNRSDKRYLSKKVDEILILSLVLEDALINL